MTRDKLEKVLREFGKEVRENPPAASGEEHCPERELIRAYHDGFLETGEISEMERHLALCPRCLRYLAAVREREATGSIAALEVPAECPSTSITAISRDLEHAVRDRGRRLISDLCERLRNLADFALPQSFSYQPATVRMRGRKTAPTPEALKALESAGKLYDEGGYEQAAIILEHAVESGFRDPGVIYYLGLCHLKLENSSQAVQYLEETVALRPGVPSCHWYLGQAYLGRGDGAAALRAFTAVLELGRKFSDEAREKIAQIEKAVNLATESETASEDDER